MKKLFFLILLCVCHRQYAQVAVNLPTGQPIDPLAAFQVCGATRIDSLPLSIVPTHVIVLDPNDSVLHKIPFTSFVSYFTQFLSTTTPIIRTYITSGIWIKPVGLRYIVVEAVGGGGNGGNTFGPNAGGGGGGGGYSRKIINTTVLGSTESVTVGISGGTSSFGLHLQASGGTNANDQVGGNGGSGSGGDFNAQGSDGANGDPTGNSTGGKGGGSILGGGGKAGSANNSNGLNGKNYGGGGGGAHDDGPGSQSGGTGSSGVVIITEFY